MLSRTRHAGPPNRSRFQEGSMNDRASAAPPVHFLENEENMPPASCFEDGKPYHYHKQNAHRITRKPVAASTPSGTVWPVRDVVMEDYMPRPQPQPMKEKPAPKKSSRIFGQVWDGVFGILSGKSSSSSSSSGGSGTSGSGRKKTPSMMSTASSSTGPSARARDSKEVKIDELRARLQHNNDSTNRPSKEDVMQSYQELVASGFFSSHAIQSTRHSRPGTAKSTTQPPVPAAGEQQPNSPPQWPLSTPSRKHNAQQILHQHQPHMLSPIPMTPGSAGSRGTKRAAATEDDEDQDAAQRFGSRKLRKSASRDVSGAGPRLRSVSSRRILSRRSFSGVPSKNQPSQSPQALVTVAGPLQPAASPNKLTKRCPPAAVAGRPSIRAPLPISGRSSSAAYQAPHGRNSSESARSYVATDLDMRVLRPRRSALTQSEARSVVPNMHRGIPGVPAIPPEFTYGEDREVGGPWRGLRRSVEKTAAPKP